VVHEQSGTRVGVAEAVEDGADAVIAPIARLSLERGGHDLAQGVEDHQRPMAAVELEPCLQGRHDLAEFGARKEIEALRDRLSCEQSSAASALPPLATANAQERTSQLLPILGGPASRVKPSRTTPSTAYSRGANSCSPSLAVLGSTRLSRVRQ
jgi:hypothetical protein